MQANRQPSTWEAQPFLWHLLRRNIPIVLFLVVALGGMFAVYWFFQPESGASASAVSAPGASGVLSAPIIKKVPARPVVQRLLQSPGPLHIAIIAGHKDNDAGAVCADGLTEAAVNQLIAAKVQQKLQSIGVRSEIFAEFDPRLANYGGTALISIHADSCDYINDLATGFKISGSSATDSSSLSTCVQSTYAAATRLPFHANTITADMTNYHAFREIAPGIPAIIIETGFLNLDRELLTSQAELPATGIVEGILCFLGEAR